MKKNILILILLSFFSCKKESISSSPILVNIIDSTGIIKKEDKTLHVDTIKLETLAAINLVDKIVITTLRTEINTDSIVKAYISFDFYYKNKLTKSLPSSILYDAEQGEWYTNENVFSTKNNDSRFLELSYGYPACGYAQTNFMFYIGVNDIQFINTNVSMSDSGYGTWTLFEPHFKEKKLIYFTSKTINVDNDQSKKPTDKDDDLVISFSDSIIYKWETNKWIGKLKSKKGKTFRKEFKKFNDFNKIE